jgi:phage-related protein
MMVNEIMNTTAGRLAKVNAESQNASLGFGGLTAQVKEAFAGFTTLLGPLASVTQALGPSLLQGAVAGLTSALPLLIANVGGLHAAFGAVSTFVSGSLIPLLTNPLTLAIMGVIAAAGLLYMAWQNNWGGIRDVTDRVVKYLRDVLGGFFDWVKGVVDMFGGWIKSIQDWWSGLVGKVKAETPTFKPPRGYMMGVEVPTMQRGGLVPETGLYLLHRGEYVVPPNQPAMNITINLNVTGARGMDEKTLAEEAARQIERKLRSVLIERTSSQAKTSRIRM